ncbi:hypothetical protein DFH06DRAFT_67747 [Mycena polygramma]|nr:hypothetical protein DFH06DRAFT_67747 [Mycena polygramma]
MNRNRNYSTQAPGREGNNLSRNPSNVSWGTKIKGAIQVGHGLGEALRGSLGATDPGGREYTSSGQIADRGRQEIAQGLARMRGVTTGLPSAPVYDRRHSYPTQQYEQPQRSASVWSRRAASAHQPRHHYNPPTASSPFEKYYEHPYPAEQEQDPGFAGLGAGVDAGRRKEGQDRIVPAFLVHPPQAAAASETPYPSRTSYPSHGGYSTQASAPHQEYSIPQSPYSASPSTSGRSPIAPPLPPRSLQPSPYHGNNAPLSAPSSAHPYSPADSSSTSAHMPQPSTSHRRSFSNLIDRSKTMRLLTGKGKGKEKQTEGSQKLGRIQSMFHASGRRTVTRPSSPDPDGYTSDNAEHHTDARTRTRSAPATPPPHRHESTLEHAGYNVLSYDVKDVYPQWPTEEEMRRSQASRSRSQGARLEPVRSARA